MSAHAKVNREPLITQAHVVAAIAGLTSALVFFGVIPATIGDELKGNADAVVGSIATIIAIATPYVHALSSRGKTTPMSDPRDNRGVQLAPVPPADPTSSVLTAVPVDPAAALAEAEAIAPTPPQVDDPEAPGYSVSAVQATVDGGV